MKNLDIETFYSKINSHIALTGVSTDSYLPTLIKMCRLKPYSLIYKPSKIKSKLETCWIDEFGNSLRINKKCINICVNDPRLEIETVHNTDLFFSRSIKSTVTDSQYFIIIKGSIYTDTNYLCGFYGIDEYLRAYLYHDSRWFRVSPLMFGINVLRYAINSCRIPVVKNININMLETELPMNVEGCLSGRLPTKKLILDKYFNDNIMKGIL